MTEAALMLGCATPRGEGRPARLSSRSAESTCIVRDARGDEAGLVSRILAGETQVFELIVRGYQDPIYGFVHRMLRDGTEAEDVAQEVFLRAYRGLSGFRGQSKLSTWLYRIAFNLCADRLRSRALIGGQTEALDEHGPKADQRSDPEDLALLSEERRAVTQAVNSLQGIYRTVVILRYYQGMSIEEISGVLGIPQKTVETRLYRARRAMRASLGAQ